VGYQLPHFCWTVNVYKSGSREMKNSFRDYCVDENLGNTDLGSYILYYSFMVVGNVK